MDMNCSYEIQFLVPFSSSYVFMKNTVNMYSGSLEYIREAEEERISLTLSIGILSQVLKNILWHNKRIITSY